MTKARIENIVSFFAGAFLMLVALIDTSGFGPAPLIQPTPEREFRTVYCLGLKVQDIYCKTVQIEYDKFTNNN